MAEIIVILAVLGLCAGSFINALVWRLHEQSKPKKSKKSVKAKDLSILNGRSMCEHCRHTLAWYDLIPLVSWISLKGRCRYCKKPISADSPALEVIMAIVLVGSYLFWPYTVHLGGQSLLLAAWLVAAVGLAALAVYDLRWMLLPNKVIYPTLAAAAAGRAGYIAFFSARPAHELAWWLGSVAIASGIFFVLFTVSKGKWIGFGDVRLGLITGTLLATPAKSFLMIFLASVLGTVAVLPLLATGRKNLSSRLPYGPFLILSTAIVVLFGQSILDWYKRLVGF